MENFTTELENFKKGYHLIQNLLFAFAPKGKKLKLVSKKGMETASTNFDNVCLNPTLIAASGDSDYIQHNKAIGLILHECCHVWYSPEKEIISESRELLNKNIFSQVKNRKYFKERGEEGEKVFSTYFSSIYFNALNIMEDSIIEYKFLKENKVFNAKYFLNIIEKEYCDIPHEEIISFENNIKEMPLLLVVAWLYHYIVSDKNGYSINSSEIIDKLREEIKSRLNNFCKNRKYMGAPEKNLIGKIYELTQKHFFLRPVCTGIDVLEEILSSHLFGGFWGAVFLDELKKHQDNTVNSDKSKGKEGNSDSDVSKEEDGKSDSNDSKEEDGNSDSDKSKGKDGKSDSNDSKEEDGNAQIPDFDFSCEVDSSKSLPILKGNGIKDFKLNNEKLEKALESELENAISTSFNRLKRSDMKFKYLPSEISEYMENQNVQHISNFTPSYSFEAEIANLLDNTDDECNTLTNCIKKELLAYTRKTYNSSASKGRRVAASKISKVAQNVYISNPFAAKGKNEALNTHIVLMADCSASMDTQNKIEGLIKGLAILGNSLGKIANQRLKFSILGFGMGRSIDSITWLKKADEKFNKDNLTKIVFNGSTPGFEGFCVAAEELYKSKMDRKIIICLTDGGFDRKPYKLTYDFLKGIECYGIGLCTDDFYRTPEFTRAFTNIKPEELPYLFKDLFCDILNQSKKDRKKLLN